MFERILRELVAKTPGAIGAVFLDSEGECVELWAERVFEIGADGLKAIGAYQGIYFTELRRICARTEAGQPERFSIDFKNARVLSSAIKDGYFIVLIVDPAANEGMAWHHLRSCRQRLLAEI